MQTQKPIAATPHQDGKKNGMKKPGFLNRVTGNYFTRKKVNALVEGADGVNGASVRELVKRANEGEAVVRVLSEMIAKGGERGAGAALMISKLSEEGINCEEAGVPLREMLFYGGAMEQGTAALALIRIRDEFALSALVDASKSRDRGIQRAAGIIVPGAKAALEEDAAKSENPRIRELCRELLGQFFCHE
ncbi:MAG: hypothetical protein WC350_04280 [Candidatus Micrarchaeia archaeon]|jgi:hypothetical protein